MRLGTGTAAAHAAWWLAARHSFFHHTLPTLTSAAGTPEEEKAFLAWVTSTTKTLVDSLWGHYWATGDTGYAPGSACVPALLRLRVH